MAKSRTIRNCNKSEKIDELSVEAERFWYRFLIELDDLGNIKAHAGIIRSLCFPLKEDITNIDVQNWLNELEKAKLIIYYCVDSKRYIHVFEFGQKMRWGNKSNVPPPPRDVVATTSGKSASTSDISETEVETETEVEIESLVFPFETEAFKKAWDLWLTYKKKAFKFKYKTAESHQAALEKLGKMADGSEEYAIYLIKYSIENQWQGFYHDKNYGKQQSTGKAGEGKNGLNTSGISELHKRTSNPSGQ